MAWVGHRRPAVASKGGVHAYHCAACALFESRDLAVVAIFRGHSSRRHIWQLDGACKSANDCGLQRAATDVRCIRGLVHASYEEATVSVVGT